MQKTKQHIKEIISTFVRKNPQEISDDTSLKISSVLKHRMYAALSEKGYHIRNRYNVKSFKDLIENLTSRPETEDKPAQEAAPVDQTPALPATPSPETNLNTASMGIDIQMGVDLEDVDSLPKVADFREEAFYKRTFSNREISYCLLQENPLQSFAGKFAAKEAIIKIDNTYAGRPMNQIEILNDMNGKPYFGNFRISISHTEQSAVAVAIRPVVVPLEPILETGTDPAGAALSSS